MLALQQNLLFFVDSISYFALSPHPTEIAWTSHTFKWVKKTVPSVAIATAVGTNCFFFSGHWPLAASALAASFQCLLFSTSTQLAVQQLQTENVCLLTRWLLFYLSKECGSIRDLNWYAWMLPYFVRTARWYSKFDFCHLLPTKSTTTATKNCLPVCFWQLWHQL